MTIRIVDGYLREYIKYTNGKTKLDRHLWDGCRIFSYRQYLVARGVRKRYLNQWVYYGYDENNNKRRTWRQTKLR